MKLWPVALGVGAAAGAVAIMMMPYNNPTRRLAAKTANKVESAVTHAADALVSEMKGM